MSILIVDDEEVLQDVLSSLLKEEGFEVLSARRGAEALQLLETEEVELVLLDMMLPDSNGLQLLRQIRANDPDLVFDASQLDEIERETMGSVVEYRGALANGLDLQVGLRHDRNEGFEDATTWALGASYPLSAATRLHASAGTGVQAPTLFDQFGFFPGLFIRFLIGRLGFS